MKKLKTRYISCYFFIEQDGAYVMYDHNNIELGWLSYHQDTGYFFVPSTLTLVPYTPVILDTAKIVDLAIFMRQLEKRDHEENTL